MPMPVFGHVATDPGTMAYAFEACKSADWQRKLCHLEQYQALPFVPRVVTYSPDHYREEFSALVEKIKAVLPEQHTQYASALAFNLICWHLEAEPREAVMLAIGDRVNLRANIVL